MGLIAGTFKSLPKKGKETSRRNTGLSRGQEKLGGKEYVTCWTLGEGGGVIAILGSQEGGKDRN